MSARFRHRLPFGAELEGDATRFRLWAPSADRLELVLDEGRRVLPARSAGEGWYEVESDAAPPGTRYAWRLPDGLEVPDPASRAQREDVHGPSLVVDPEGYEWRHPDWAGRPWHEAVLYELHAGLMGGFDGVRRRLPGLAALGITAVELMPVADFPGSRGWGYDGVLPFAPERAYGSPEDLKRLVDEAHGHGLMMFLDVVYNHFGPDGNYLHVYAKPFFDEHRHTPWGAAIDFGREPVREFFIGNALYWLEEYRFDGLRLDAVHAIAGDWRQEFLAELGDRVRATCGDRRVHLVLENDANESRWMRGAYQAQWNDDIHHVAHVLVTGESGGYYCDYQDDPVALFGRALSEGFVYQGEPSAHRDGQPRGEPSADLPPTAFVGFLQNHDQVGNRALGERLAALAPRPALEVMTAVNLLAPHVPMLFMGEEQAATAPFLFFCDFGDELADAVREGRRREFESFPEFSSPEARARIPDPNAAATFEACRLPEAPAGEAAEFYRFVQRLLELRREYIVPRLAGAGRGTATRTGDRSLSVSWPLGDGSTLELFARLGEAQPAPVPRAAEPLFTWPAAGAGDAAWAAWLWLDPLVR